MRGFILVGEWPVDGFDVHAIAWRPTPLSQFVLKMHARCNLACDYCYMYEAVDQSWRDSPRQMSAETLRRTGERIAQHARRHQLDKVQVIFHGGEPLLAGASTLARSATTLRAAMPEGTAVAFSVQTNGTLLDETALAELARENIRIAVSLDGDQATHDRHRQRPGGARSHAATVRALRLLCSGKHRPLFAGLLTVVDLTADPVGVYESLLEFTPPQVDFLLPHANWSAPPLRQGSPYNREYGEWLARAFDRWYGAPRQETCVRLFREIIHLLLGGASETEQIGLSAAAMIVVNTDGGLEQVDALRTAYAGAVQTALTVFDNDMDDALRHPAIVARQIGLAALADSCQRCPVRRVCGGGHYAHRYRRGSGFRNPSVYCRDLQYLIRHVGDRLRQDLTTLRDANP
ncbi:MAG: FxsB family radical SAM/SPASM domain protein [Actinomycetota bacterium]|nr:FxsB family radical SAM/SPASM domain protein [Actinomycetota bacterium]